MRTQVAIIGAGPAGLMLGLMLERAGIDAVILERRSADHVLSRIRAGVLEHNTVALMRRYGVGARMDAQGLPHGGVALAFDGDTLRLDFEALVGKTVMVYGQTEVTRDLMDARAQSGARTVYQAQDVTIEGLEAPTSTLRYAHGGETHELRCDFVVGCDGYHGVSRRAVPDGALTVFERDYGIGWLGVMVDQPPVDDELIYAHHQRGFALCSMRNTARSRYYVQVPKGERVDAWSDARFWDELRARLAPQTAARLQVGPSIEKSIAPMRSFVVEPVRFGNLFLAGDAAHIVPPTGAKGLNMAIRDVQLLAQAMRAHYQEHSAADLDAYSGRVLANTWRTERFSFWMTQLLHTFPEAGAFGRRIQRAEFDYLGDSRFAQQSLAENYTGVALDA